MVKTDSSVTLSETVVIYDPITVIFVFLTAFAIMYCNYLCIAILSNFLDCELLKSKDLIYCLLELDT